MLWSGVSSQFKIALLVWSVSLDIELFTSINWMTTFWIINAQMSVFQMYINEGFSFTDKPYLGSSPVNTYVHICLIV